MVPFFLVSRFRQFSHKFCPVTPELGTQVSWWTIQHLPFVFPPSSYDLPCHIYSWCTHLKSSLVSNVDQCGVQCQPQCVTISSSHVFGRERSLVCDTLLPVSHGQGSQHQPLCNRSLVAWVHAAGDANIHDVLKNFTPKKAFFLLWSAVQTYWWEKNTRRPTCHKVSQSQAGPWPLPWTSCSYRSWAQSRSWLSASTECLYSHRLAWDRLCLVRAERKIMNFIKLKPSEVVASSKYLPPD